MLCGLLSMRSGRSLGLVLVGSLLCLVACAPDLPDDLPSLVQLMASNDMNIHTHEPPRVFRRPVGLSQATMACPLFA